MSSTTTEVLVPDIGDFHDVEVIEVLVKVGDRIQKDASLVSLESDKATMEVPSPAAGTVRQVRVKVGQRVSEGSPILTLEADGAGAGAGAAPAPAQAPAEKKAPEKPPAGAAEPAAPPPSPVPEYRPPPVEAPADVTGGSKPHASPGVRRFARELGVDLPRVRGSGPKGRILREDVQSFVKGVMARGVGAAPAAGAGLPELPEIDFTKFGPVETKALNKIRRLAGANLHRTWVHVPHVTQFDEADITELEAFRKEQSEAAAKQGAKLTPLAFLIKASVRALQEFPEFNSSLDKKGENLVLKRYWHIGFAADTPEGLVVPVIRDADRKSVIELARELGELSKRAREKKLGPAEMQGATFTISSLGGIGGTAFTPIVNWPDVAILGVSRSRTVPQWDGKAFQPRLMLPLSLSYDHRVIDGAAAARFTAYLAGLLTDIRRLVL